MTNKWTTEIPKVGGLYMAIRVNDDIATWVKVEIFGSEIDCREFHNSRIETPDKYSNWFGPLPEPKRPPFDHNHPSRHID